jgi:hypothetical protein
MNAFLSPFINLNNVVSAHASTGQQWALVLNILKFIGAALAGTAGVIGILTETKTADPSAPDEKHLAKSGEILLGFGIAGLAIALTSQIVEWVKTGCDAQAAQQQNAAMLSEIRKARHRALHTRRYVELLLWSTYSFPRNV